MKGQIIDILAVKTYASDKGCLYIVEISYCKKHYVWDGPIKNT